MPWQDCSNLKLNDKLIKIISDEKIFFENCEAVIDFSFAGATIENITNASKNNCIYVLL